MLDNPWIKNLRRAIAWGFIILILLGNYWFVYLVTGRQPPSWLVTLFSAMMLLLMVIAGLWGIVYGLAWLKEFRQKEPPEV